MIPAGLTPFETSLVVGLASAGGAFLSTYWYESLPKPSQTQKRLFHIAFSLTFLGFLVFGFTPIFLWLLFL